MGVIEDTTVLDVDQGRRCDPVHVSGEVEVEVHLAFDLFLPSIFVYIYLLVVVVVLRGGQAKHFGQSTTASTFHHFCLFFLHFFQFFRIRGHHFRH